MTKREAVVISAYTGVMCVEFSDMHKYIEEIMERPVFTHELADQDVVDEIIKRAKPEFLEICENVND